MSIAHLQFRRQKTSSTNTDSSVSATWCQYPAVNFEAPIWKGKTQSKLRRKSEDSSQAFVKLKHWQAKTEENSKVKSRVYRI